MSEYPPFRFGQSRFDQNTFRGRFRHFLDVIDPRTLFTTQKRLQQSCELLERFREGRLEEGVTDKQLWEAQKIKQAILHPDTGDQVFMPFRMSGFVPFGTPVVVGLLLPNQTLLSTVFWQWLNQSHNACVNYCNRNASRPAPFSTFFLGYLGAVSSAVSIASFCRLYKRVRQTRPGRRPRTGGRSGTKRNHKNHRTLEPPRIRTRSSTAADVQTAPASLCGPQTAPGPGSPWSVSMLQGLFCWSGNPGAPPPTVPGWSGPGAEDLVLVLLRFCWTGAEDRVSGPAWRSSASARRPGVRGSSRKSRRRPGAPISRTI